nr:MAG TPA: hypothetical protein [Caudoviricetes sp.]
MIFYEILILLGVPTSPLQSKIVKSTTLLLPKLITIYNFITIFYTRLN